jgi:hypothetical protein
MMKTAKAAISLWLGPREKRRLAVRRTGGVFTRSLFSANNKNATDTNAINDITGHCERSAGAKQSHSVRKRLLRHFVPRNDTFLIRLYYYHEQFGDCAHEGSRFGQESVKTGIEISAFHQIAGFLF